MSNLPGGWQETTLGAISTKPQYGWTTKARSTGPGPRLLRTTDITSGEIDWTQVPYCTHEPDDVEKFLLKTDDIVVSRAGSVGASIRLNAPPQAVFASYLIRLRVLGDVDPAYVAWFLKSPDYWQQVREAAAGIALLNVNAKKLAAIRIPLAPLSMQRRIVAAIEEQFSRLDAARTSLALANRRLVTLRKLVFSLPFESLSPIFRLSDVAQVVSGQTPKGLVVPSHGPVPFFKVGDMNAAEGHEMAGARSYVDEKTIDQFKLKVRPAGTVIFPKRGGAIATNKKRILREPAAFDLNTMGLVPSEVLLPKYLLYWLETKDLASLADGSNVPQINLPDISPLEIPVPSLKDQHHLIGELGRQISLVDAMTAEVARAMSRSVKMSQSILHQAFSGKLVPQDPSDEPASAQLKRITSAREGEAKVSRKRKKVPA